MKSYLYVLENSDNKNIKIGVSIDPLRRFTDLKNQGGFKSENSKVFGPLDNAYELERILHWNFRAGRYVGEWFKLDFSDTVKKIEDEDFELKIPEKVTSLARVKTERKYTLGEVAKKRVQNLSAIQRFILNQVDKYGECRHTRKKPNWARLSTYTSLEAAGFIKRVPQEEEDQKTTIWIKNDQPD